MPTCPRCHDQNPQLGAKCPRDGGYYIPDEAVKDAERDPLIGSLVDGKFVILSLINEGGMGAVYRALQLSVDREVAFKVLRNELKDHDQVHERFQREARAVSKLDHPNIVTMFDFGVDPDNQPYMVMEYAPGPSLAAWLRREALTTERILSVTYQMLSALSAAHRCGIVHRDLKPENMIIREGVDGEGEVVKLLDFGIARMINESATKKLTKEGEVFGTPHYMAPEQAQGKKDIGPPADVYAVGVMLHEMITGACPFDAPTPLTVLFMHITEPMPPLVARPGIHLPEGLASLVATATAKDPQDRYQSAQEMLRALQRFARGAMMGAPLAPGSISGEFFTPVPGAAPHTGVHAVDARPTPVPTLQTPAQGTLPVAVHDPEPSVEMGARETAAPLTEGFEGLSSARDNRRLLIVAAVLVLLVTGAIAGVAIIANVGSGEVSEASEGQLDEDLVGGAAPAEIAPARPDEPAAAYAGADVEAAQEAETAVEKEGEKDGEKEGEAAQAQEAEDAAEAAGVAAAPQVEPSPERASQPAARPAPKAAPRPAPKLAPKSATADSKEAQESAEDEKDEGPKPMRFDRLKNKKKEPAAPAKPAPARFDRL